MEHILELRWKKNPFSWCFFPPISVFKVLGIVCHHNTVFLAQPISYSFDCTLLCWYLTTKQNRLNEKRKVCPGDVVLNLFQSRIQNVFNSWKINEHPFQTFSMQSLPETFMKLKDNLYLQNHWSYPLLCVIFLHKYPVIFS